MWRFQRMLGRSPEPIPEPETSINAKSHCHPNNVMVTVVVLEAGRIRTAAAVQASNGVSNGANAALLGSVCP
jgi:hypothetical protein